ncbi:MAG: hypothetical protein J7K02_12535 [Deltaproteobacteria bacterium]|nr:hypothetical protein [Deltaproteobacteria bacterium]
MTKDQIIKRNLDLLNEFMKIAFDQPDILNKIPKEAELVILPENDPELYKANFKIKQSLEKKGKKFVVVRMRKPERVPPPDIELAQVASEKRSQPLT